MFSIIIPLYNKAPYIAKALQSVVNQTYKEFELIVINDGSTDNSFEVAKAVLSQTANLDYQLVDQPNTGVSTVRNNGVKIAKYDYITFLDADDWWAPTFLEEMKALTEEFPDAGIYGSGYYKVRKGKYISAQIGVEKGFERGCFDYIHAYTVSPWMPLTSISVVIPKKIFNQMQGFKPQLKLGEDFDLWVRIALQCKTVLLNKPLAYYNQDIDEQNRAVGGRIHKPDEHMLFALTDLYEQEKNNPKLKQMMDRLRVFSLLPYYLNKSTRSDAKREIARVDWNMQSKQAYRQYNKTPVVWLKVKHCILKMGSKLKNKIMKRS